MSVGPLLVALEKDKSKKSSTPSRDGTTVSPEKLDELRGKMEQIVMMSSNSTKKGQEGEARVPRMKG